MVLTSSLKNRKKNLELFLSKCSEHSFLILRWLLNRFSKSFPWPTLNLIGLQVSISLSQKAVSTLLLKNLQKTEKCPFQTLRTYSFLTSKYLQNHFLRSFLGPNFDLNDFEYFCLTFPENGFNFVNQKLAQN